MDRPTLQGQLKWGDDILVSDIKVGDYLDRPKRLGGEEGPISGKIKKVNPKTIVIETIYGAWGGQAGTPMDITLKKASVDQQGNYIGRGTLVHEINPNIHPVQQPRGKAPSDKIAVEDDLIQRVTEGSLSAYSTTSFTKEQKNALARLIRRGKIVKVEQPMYSGPGNRYRYMVPGVAYDALGKMVDKSNYPVNMKWDDMHVQAREELLSGAGFNTKLATKKWSELEPWEQELLKESLEGRSKGKVKLETALNTENKNNKAPWEMTREEWRDAKQPSYEFYKEMGWPEGYVYDREPGYRYGTSHLGWIKTAIHKGKKVPDEILRMYPQLLDDEAIRVLKPEAYKQIEKAIGKTKSDWHDEYRETEEKWWAAEKEHGKDSAEAKRLHDSLEEMLDESQARFKRRQKIEGKKGLDALAEANDGTSLQSIESNRSALSQSSDERQEHSLIIEPDDPRVSTWKRDPGRMDVRGIDTPARGTKRTKHKHDRKSPLTSLQGTR